MAKGYLDKVSILGKDYSYYNIVEFSKNHGIDLSKTPFSIKILIENLLRSGFEEEKIAEFVKHKNANGDFEFPFFPSRVLMQDFTGVPAVVDLAAMRNEMIKRGKNPDLVNPLNQTDLVIDHSIQVDSWAGENSHNENLGLEFERNKERYEFLKWGQSAFNNFKVVPPGMGICHQINLEFLAPIVSQKDGVLFPDTVVGTDSHTTMINGIGVLGWGVGGIEAESVMLNQPIYMTKPDVVGVKLTGKLASGVGAMDLVLTITNLLRKKGVVGKFVEYFGSGVSNLTLPDRATIANMSPEYGATCGIFAIDQESIEYAKLSGRSDEQIAIIKEYAKVQNIWFNPEVDPQYDDVLEVDLSSIQPVLAGPKRPQDKVLMSEVGKSFKALIDGNFEYEKEKLSHGSVVIAAITSCTNTSNPYSLMAAGLLAKKAVEMGIKVPNFVKTSFSPGSQVVGKYMQDSGLQAYMDKLGFNIVGYGCMTCIGNSGPLKQEFENEINEKSLTVAAVISGNRNFEGRVHPLVKANYLASPAIVIAYAIAGNVSIDLLKDPIANVSGRDIFFKDLMPSSDEISEVVGRYLSSNIFTQKYSVVFDGDENWKKVESVKSNVYKWNDKSTYIENPPYFEKSGEISDIKSARIIAHFGDSITTDHISPAGNISIKSPAAKYLLDSGVEKKDFNSYGARRGSHSVMMRGTFANIRIKNLLLDGLEGGLAKSKSGNIESIYDVAMENKADGVKSIIFAGKEYGSGSSRDWAAKGTKLLGIAAVIAESFERIHRSNLAGMGVLPLEFTSGIKASDLDLKNVKNIDITGISKNMTTKQVLKCKLHYEDGNSREIDVLCRLDTAVEIKYFFAGSIFHYVADLLESKE
ncbi:aconitate hydratase AcnA [Candidatus Deianiraea vastatrix]|uniref:Aconitate hydratase n=1 Tax=Candidatus Deianiraea vastatrix TaxID=2163644 RepID=A0A5B8XJV7_9RICK|nr:aconitate hydratase AcnA [Candidatus Deianiraea vastatrix]QED23807.1 Aconitate hydratase [Candidatus Deianiraea vastatrix]